MEKISLNLEELSSRGSLSSLSDAASKKEAIIAGRIVRVCSLKVPCKTNRQSLAVKIFTLKEVLVPKGKQPKEFRLLFFNKIAGIISSVDLLINDCVAVYKPVVAKNSAFSQLKSDHTLQVVVGFYHHSVSLGNILVKKAKMEHWTPVSKIRTIENKRVSSMNGKNKAVFSRDKEDNSCPCLPSKRNLCSAIESHKKYKRITLCSSSSDPESEPVQPPVKKPFIKILPRSSSNIFDEGSSGSDNKSENVVVHSQEEIRPTIDEQNSLSVCSSKRPSDIVIECHRLNDVNEDIYNVYGIIRSVEKPPTSIHEGKYCVHLTITDETKSDLPVQIHCKSDGHDPLVLLREGFIIRFHRLMIEKKDSRIHGIVSNLHDVAIFDPNNGDVIYSVAVQTSYTEEDRRRLVKLKEFIANGDVPFRKLEELTFDLCVFNLKCKIVDIKKYAKDDAIMLRVCDGTICTVPTIPSRFSNRCKMIDVMVQNPVDTFKTLAPGDIVQLIGIRTEIANVLRGADRIGQLKFFLRGNEDNLIIEEKLNSSSMAPSAGSCSEVNDVLPDEAPVSDEIKGRVASSTDVEKQNTTVRNSLDDCRLNKGNTLSEMAKLVCSEVNNQLSDKTPTSNKIRSIVPFLRKFKAVASSTEAEEQNIAICSSVDDCWLNEKNMVSEIAKLVAVKNITGSKMKQTSSSGRKEITAAKAVNEAELKYLKAWPTVEPDLPFCIPACIIATFPHICEESNELDIMRFLTTFCPRCDKYYPIFAVDWRRLSDEYHHPVCSYCTLNDESKMAIELLLMCNMILEDENGTMVKAVVIDKHAEMFFGCTVGELCLKTEVRRNLKLALLKYVSGLKVKERLFILFRAVQIKNSHVGDDFRYHIFNTKLTDLVHNEESTSALNAGC